MKRLMREEVQVERLLEAVRTIAVIDKHPKDHSEPVVEYLRHAGFDVFPVREDRAEVGGLASWMSLAHVPGNVDIVLFLDRAVVDAATVEEAARKHARALWLAPGVDAGDAEALAKAHDLELVVGRDIVEEHRHTRQVAGQPRKRGVNVGGRKRQFEDDRKRIEETGYVPGGGGGHKGGGGKHAILDEKKMVGGKPSPRRGPLRRPGDPA